MNADVSVNDTNEHLVNFYRWLQKGFVIDMLMENDQTLFYALRQKFNALIAKGTTDTKEAHG